MRNNEGDKLVRDKITGLDTLAGGIVYGKEEAWDRLQARMEHKPAKRIALRYWMAAAAVLLVFVSVTAVYFYPAKQVDVVKVEKEPAPVNNTELSETKATQVMAQPEKMMVHTTTASADKRMKYKQLLKNEDNVVEEKVTVIQPPPVAIEEHKNIDIVPPPAPIVKAMKVVHINDLENGSTAAYHAQEANTSVALNKLPVVYINDVEREDIKVREILRGNRMTYVHIPFYRSKYDYEEPATGTEEYHQPINFLKRKVNTPN